ncbi:hypothetical protein Rcae01_04072 [Novipirellula caenicola]|uniref:RedB protein n=2 Tax=Novipirellula caenicola TaxID=1536901 RepID=A0ABP9VTZ4_9BACT
MISTPSDCQQAIGPYSHNPTEKRIPRWCLIVAMGCWLAAVLTFVTWITAYGFKVDASNLADSEETWPADTTLAIPADRPTLVLFVHPKCPCSRATLVELEKILTASPAITTAAPSVLVVASVPRDADTTWTHSPLIQRAAELANADVVFDVEGVETARFGVTTSGTVMLFDHHATRTFSGGITTSRGHEGRSVGGDLLRDRLLVATKVDIDGISDDAAKSPPVFGCILCTPRIPVNRNQPSPRCVEAAAW